MSSQDKDQHSAGQDSAGQDSADQHDAGHPENEDAKVREGTENLQELADEVEMEREKSRENINSLPQSLDPENPPHEDEENKEGSELFPDEVQVLPAVRPHP